MSNDVFITPYYLRTIINISKKITNFGTIRGVSNFVDNGSKLHNIDIKNKIKNIDQISEFSKKIYEDKKISFFEEKFLTGDVFLVNRKSLDYTGIEYFVNKHVKLFLFY